MGLVIDLFVSLALLLFFFFHFLFFNELPPAQSAWFLTQRLEPRLY